MVMAWVFYHVALQIRLLLGVLVSGNIAFLCKNFNNSVLSCLGEVRVWILKLQLQTVGSWESWKGVHSGGHAEKRNCTGFGPTTPGSHNRIWENWILWKYIVLLKARGSRVQGRVSSLGGWTWQLSTTLVRKQDLGAEKGLRRQVLCWNKVRRGVLLSCVQWMLMALTLKERVFEDASQGARWASTIYLMYVKNQADQRCCGRLSGDCGEPYLLPSFGFLFCYNPSLLTPSPHEPSPLNIMAWFLHSLREIQNGTAENSSSWKGAGPGTTEEPPTAARG